MVLNENLFQTKIKQTIFNEESASDMDCGRNVYQMMHWFKFKKILLKDF